MRPKALLQLLRSVSLQSCYPDSILIVDGSTNDETGIMINEHEFKNLLYYKIEDKDRGLTRQRNYGVKKAPEETDIICFLDDDIILDKTYFEYLIDTYKLKKDALGVGGYITNEVSWKEIEEVNYQPTIKEFSYDGYKRKEGSRYIARKLLKLDSDVSPGFFPEFGHGRSIGFLPPSDKVYPVEHFMGGVASYKKEVFDKVIFSDYFSGYGLYEDADFCFRLNELGNLYVNTSAKCEHHHAPSGRPNFFKYGKMVLINGWYVWRVRHQTPSLKAKIKWNLIAFLLTSVRFINIITTKNRKEAFMEAMGRFVGRLTLFFKKPIHAK